MEVNYIVGKTELKLSAKGERFLLINNRQNVFTCSFGKRSRYDGFVCNFGGQNLKVIDQITSEVASEVKGVNHKGYKLEVIRNNLREEFYVPSNYSSLVYTTNKKCKVNIQFDIKGIFDNGEWERRYSVLNHRGVNVIEFQRGDLNVFVAISAPLTRNAKWSEIHLEHDRQRNSPPFSRYVYSPGVFDGQLFVISVASSPELAVSECEYLRANLPKVEARDAKEFNSKIKEFDNTDVSVAYNLSKHYLSKLATENGVLAGYPWFPQVWTRDELISLKGLMLSGNKPYVKERVLRYIEQVQFDGRLPNHFWGTEKNSDSAGWFFRRTLDLIGGNVFDGKELLLLNERCRTASACLDKYFRKGGLINSPAGSTWMDSLERAGARLEIQALDYSLFELLKQLTRDTEFLKHQHRLARLVKSEFFKSNYLWDSPDDPTIRPNIFLAAYAAPRLLRSEEWGKCIRKALKALWNDWGGLATIDKSSPNFQSAHTGENPLSYHNGDSWFFVNNLAGVAMSRMKGFSRHTRRILEASTCEILRHGCLGCHGELSSSGELDSAGTWLQAWSSATYIELVEALEKLE